MNLATVNRQFNQAADLFSWKVADNDNVVSPWKPVVLDHKSWPPNYRAVYAWRIKQLAALRSNPALMASARAYYASRPEEFIMHWMDTYDPRRKGSKWIPFVLFNRQSDFIQFLVECSRDDADGLTEKCRDAGVTWLACAYSIHSWLFLKDDIIGWGSRKQELVDKIGDPSSIFEKLRLIVRRLPNIWKPKGFREDVHATRMKLINPANGSVIIGEIGDKIGRGGRTRIYFKDESAHYEHPEQVEAALGDNTRCQIDISSVNGLGNVFHRKREAGIDWYRGSPHLKPGFTRVFVFDYSDHPEKTVEWFNQRKAKAIREGMQHIFAQEVERNYSASVSNTIINYEWIRSAVDAHFQFVWNNNGQRQVGITPEMIPNNWIAGLDVADEGIDRNALSLRQWIIWRSIEEWGERDPGVTARRAMHALKLHRVKHAIRTTIETEYDSIGIGSNVKSEFNRLVESGELDATHFNFVGWNAGASVVDPFLRVIPDDDESPINKDFFFNFKAQAWWSLRTRFYKTWNNVTNGVMYPFEEMISLDSRMPLLQQLMKELAQPTQGPSASSLRMVVDKKPDGTKSPNLADAGVMMYFPVRQITGAMIGSYSA